MPQYPVSITKYEQANASVGKAVASCCGLKHMPPKSRVFIKPNIVIFGRPEGFPKWGVITTTRVVEDMILLLKEHGIEHITIGEGFAWLKSDTGDAAALAFKALGYDQLQKRYDVRLMDTLTRPFQTVELGQGIALNFNIDILDSDFVVNLPVLKTHTQTKVSLGIKNLKGLIDMKSRMQCHNADLKKDLNFHIAKLADKMPPMLTLIDGIYTNALGPGINGHIRRSNVLVASGDILSADFVGSLVLGYQPADIPHLAMAAHNRRRPADLSDIDLHGVPIEKVANRHAYNFRFTETATACLPDAMVKQGITGLFFRKPDHSLCTGCAIIIGIVLSTIQAAWKSRAWDRVEILTGKKMKPTPGMNKTILFGKCMCQKHKNTPLINEMIPVKGCPPHPDDIIAALRCAGIEAKPFFFENMDLISAMFMAKYKNKSEFDPSFFDVTSAGNAHHEN